MVIFVHRHHLTHHLHPMNNQYSFHYQLIITQQVRCQIQQQLIQLIQMLNHLYPQVFQIHRRRRLSINKTFISRRIHFSPTVIKVFSTTKTKHPFISKSHSYNDQSSVIIIDIIVNIIVD